jgi:hypothetical protein
MADHLFAAAAKYQVAGLQALASEQLASRLSVESVCDCLSLAHAHGDAELQRRCAALVARDMLAVTQVRGAWCVVCGASRAAIPLSY